MTRISVLLLAVVASGCVTTRSGLDVDLALRTVQRPQDVADRWGDYTLEPADSSGYTYEDDLISLAVVPLGGSFSTVIENRTEHSIRLLWSDASYVGPNGFSSGVVPGETRWIDMGNAPARQVIPTQAMAAIVMIPRANANTSEMEIEPFYPRTASCDVVPDSMIRLILPIEIQGVTNEYTLEFAPAEAAIVTWSINTMDGTVQEEAREPCGSADVSFRDAHRWFATGGLTSG